MKSSIIHTFTKIVVLQIAIDVGFFMSVLQWLELNSDGQFHVSRCSISFVGCIFSRVSNRKRVLVNDFYFMNSSVYWLSLHIFLLHPFYFTDSDCFSILIRMSLSIEQLHNSFLLISDILDHDFNCFFTIFISHFEVFTKVIEDIAIRSFAFHHNELYPIFPTVWVQFE